MIAGETYKYNIFKALGNVASEPDESKREQRFKSLNSYLLSNRLYVLRYMLDHLERNHGSGVNKQMIEEFTEALKNKINEQSQNEFEVYKCSPENILSLYTLEEIIKNVEIALELVENTKDPKSQKTLFYDIQDQLMAMPQYIKEHLSKTVLASNSDENKVIDDLKKVLINSLQINTNGCSPQAVISSSVEDYIDEQKRYYDILTLNTVAFKMPKKSSNNFQL